MICGLGGIKSAKALRDGSPAGRASHLSQPFGCSGSRKGCLRGWRLSHEHVFIWPIIWENELRQRRPGARRGPLSLVQEDASFRLRLRVFPPSLPLGAGVGPMTEISSIDLRWRTGARIDRTSVCPYHQSCPGRAARIRCRCRLPGTARISGGVAQMVRATDS